MAGSRSRVRLQGHEMWSEEYEGMIDRGDGTFRVPFTWVNKKGKTRAANRYFFLAPCSVCTKPNMVEIQNYAKHPNTYCSDECRKEAKSKPDGSKKFKRGAGSDSHVLVKQQDHPAAKKGYVPEHRLVMEGIVGRYLNPEERVHHINCVKDDNRPENLALCENDTEHFLAHGSLNRCVAELIELGVLTFDRETMSYGVVADVRVLDLKGKGQAVADALLIARFGGPEQGARARNA